METKGLSLLKIQYIDLLRNPIPRVSVERNKKNLKEFTYVIIGPQNTVYEDIKILIKFTYNDNYPESKPIIKFVKDIRHPNILFSTGEYDGVCCDLFKNWINYSLEEKSIKQQILAIINMLINPNFQTGYANFDITQKDLFTKNKSEYRKYLMENLKDYYKQ